MGDAPASPDDILIDVLKEAIRSGSDPARDAAFAARGLPDVARTFLKRANETQRMIAGQFATNWLRGQGDVEGAYAIGVFLACRAADSGDVEPLMLSNLLTSACSLAVDTGHDAMVRRKAPTWAKLLTDRGQLDGARQLRLHHIEALLNAGEYEAARGLLEADAAEEALPSALAPIYERLRRKVSEILLRPDQKTEPADPTRVLRLTLDSFRQRDPDNPIVAQLQNMLQTEAAQRPAGGFPDEPPPLSPAFPRAPDEPRAILAAAEGLATSRTPLHALNAVHRAIGRHLAEPGSDRDTYATLLDAARLTVAAADWLELWEHGCDTRWVEAILLRRLGRQQEALSRLQALTARVDACRARISDPRWRAGIAVYLRHLSWVTAETALALGDMPAMLHAMETSKARILAELRQAQHVVDTPPNLQFFLHAVRDGLAAGGGRAHLLAFLCDPDATPGSVGTLALLLTADGALRAHSVRLAPGEITAILSLLQERIRGGTRRYITSIDPLQPEQRPFDDVAVALSPLVEWLAPLIDTAIAEGDTLVVSPDGPIHNVPFGMLALAGAPLVERLAVVAIPSAALLARQGAAERPLRAVALLVPSPSEQKAGVTYAEEAEALAALLATERVVDADGLAAALTAQPRPALLHVAAHGEASTARPLQERGIGLGGGGAVCLNAEQVGALEVVGAHISLRACLIGLSTEITSREALGFVWSLLGAGTATLTSGVWAVNIASAARYFALFYDAWLGEGQSRAAAHRAACRALRADGGALAHPYHWAPFILTVATLAGDVL